MNQKSTWKTLSVFVSSTFADMDAERDYLNYHVFPLVNERLRPYHISLRVIDLRWGINTEKMDEQTVERKIMRVCFDEIERSKPFFIGLLGNRYGWVPSLQSDSQFAGMSITAREIWHGFLKREDDISGCIFMEREAACLEAIPKEKRAIYDDAFSTDLDIRATHPVKLKELKASIIEHFNITGEQRRYQPYTAQWNGEKFIGLKAFGDAVFYAILAEVGKRYGNLPYSCELLEIISRAEDEFVYDKLRYPYPNQNFHEKVRKAVAQAQGVLALTGSSGSGKSSLYAHLVHSFLTPQYITLYHSTAAGNNFDLIDVLHYWNHCLEDALSQSHVDTSTIETTISRFQKLVARTPQGHKTLVFIDGIEAFESSQYTRFLSFFTRVQDERWAMVITCPIENACSVAKYHRSLQSIPIPPLEKDDAIQIIANITKDEHKELAEDIIRHLLSKCDHEGTPYFSNPLWLSLAIEQIKCFSQSDFSAIRQYGNDYNRAFISYTKEKIDGMNPFISELLLGFLQTLESFYGLLPRKLFELLSVSLYGLQEETIAALLTTDYLPVQFATVRGFLCDFVAEQGDEKYWRITHSVCRLSLEPEQRARIAENIALYYMAQLEQEKPVTDNISHYLFLARKHELTRKYLTLLKDSVRVRLTEEIAELAKYNDCMEIMRFLIEGARNDKKPSRFVDFFAVSRLRVAVLSLLKETFDIGNYEKTLALAEAAIRAIDELHISEDIKILIYILIEPYHEKSLRQLVSDAEYIEALQDAIRRIRPRGLFSLLVAPISRKYYKWLITKTQLK